MLLALLLCAPGATAPGAQGSQSAPTPAPPITTTGTTTGTPTGAAPTDWPVFRGDPALTGVAGGTLPAAPVQRWSFQAEKGIVSSPVVAAGTLVIGCDDGNVYALDARTGEKRWAFPTGDVIEAPPLIAEGAVYIGSSNGWFYSLALADGALRWKRETGDKILGGANLAHAGGEARGVVGS